MNVLFRAGPPGQLNLLFIKPVLRPLSDMTEEEGTVFAQRIYAGIFNDTSLVLVEKMSADENAVGFKLKDQFDGEIGLTIEVDRGVEFSSNGTKLMVNQFDATAELLKQGFDLFGLIPSVEAINKNTIK